VYNNNAWGVWNAGSNSRRAQHMYLFQENLRYDKIAEALGCRGEYVTSPEEFTPALERSYKMAAAEGVSTLINCQGKKEFSSARDYAPGTPRPAEPGATAFAH
jgi:thiamine pyrophosphate-dependent acetolactate synthase large subunit-like protein